MNWNQVEGNWKQFKGSVKAKWGQLSVRFSCSLCCGDSEVPMLLASSVLSGGVAAYTNNVVTVRAVANIFEIKFFMLIPLLKVKLSI